MSSGGLRLPAMPLRLPLPMVGEGGSDFGGDQRRRTTADSIASQDLQQVGDLQLMKVILQCPDGMDSSSMAFVIIYID